MHILFFTPYFNQPRGNATTSKRIIHFLQKQGIEASVFPYEEKDYWNLPSPDVIHILHATRFVEWAKENNYQINRPYIVSMGGTDINLDLQNEMSEEVFTLLDGASSITVFTEDARSKVAVLQANWYKKTEIIPQPAWVAWSGIQPVNYNAPHILLPAGLRPIKDVLHVLPALDELVQRYLGLRFTIIGANLQESVFEQVMSACATRPWMLYAGVVPFDVMVHWYNQANIVINTSISEGQSLAVMEAMSVGRPVIARGNEANKSIIRTGQTGFIYNTMDEFATGIDSIMTDAPLREQVISQSKEWIHRHASPWEEAKQYIRLYRTASR